jgi:hypothetical protein
MTLDDVRIVRCHMCGRDALTTRTAALLRKVTDRPFGFLSLPEDVREYAFWPRVWGYANGRPVCVGCHKRGAE